MMFHLDVLPHVLQDVLFRFFRGRGICCRPFVGLPGLHFIGKEQVNVAWGAVQVVVVKLSHRLAFQQDGTCLHFVEQVDDL